MCLLEKKSNFEEASSESKQYVYSHKTLFTMINRMSHVSIYVLNQDEAQDFYVNKLGFELRNNVPMGPVVRWLTVSPKDQPELEIVLILVSDAMMFTKESAEQMRELVKKGTFGFGVFECNDIYATYEELKAKGVEFTKAPKQEFYGMEAIFKDNSGNWFSLGQKENAGQKAAK